MNRSANKLLFDISNSITSIENYLGDKRIFQEYQKNQMLKRAIEREFEIIGEAMNQLLKLEPDISISEKRRIVDLRNRIIHGYDMIDDANIWAIIINHLPNLKEQVNKLIIT